MDNYIKVEIMSRSDNERLSRSIAAAFALSSDPTLEEINEIKTAVSEAVTNAIIHGYEDSEGIVCMECASCANVITIKISDTGKGIENIDQAMEPLYTGKPDSERTGLGFTIMQTFMDSVEVQSKKGEGTTVTMTKKIGTN